MGANEKKQAVGYTPEVADIREKYVYSRGNDGCREDESRTEFDRMIAKVRAEAKAEALNESATYVGEWVGIVGDGALVDLKTASEYGDTAEWLRARANQYKENQ